MEDILERYNRALGKLARGTVSKGRPEQPWVARWLANLRCMEHACGPEVNERRSFAFGCQPGREARAALRQCSLAALSQLGQHLLSAIPISHLSARRRLRLRGRC